jgi:hypothetical protein
MTAGPCDGSAGLAKSAADRCQSTAVRFKSTAGLASRTAELCQSTAARFKSTADRCQNPAARFDRLARFGESTVPSSRRAATGCQITAGLANLRTALAQTLAGLP